MKILSMPFFHLKKINHHKATNHMVRLVAGSVAFTLLPVASAWSQSGASVPSTVQPGRVEQQLGVTPSITTQPQVIASPSAQKQVAPAGAESIKFALKRVTLLGNKAINHEELKVYWEGMLNKEISLADVYTLATKLGDAYRSAGYLLAQVLVPTQKITQGEINLHVIEGSIGKISVQNAAGEKQLRLEKHLGPIQSEKPLKAQTLERHLLLVNELGGVNARAFLQASQKPGATDLNVITQQQGVTGSLTIDNRVSSLLGASQIEANVQISDVITDFDRHTIRVVSSDTTDLFYVGYSAEWPIGIDGLKLTTTLSSSRSKPVLPNLNDLRTQSTTASLTATYPILRSRESNLAIRGGVSFFESKTSLASLVSDQYRLSTLKLGLNWDMVDAFNGVNLLDVESTVGVKGLSAFDDMNVNGDNRKFTKMQLYAARLQSIAPSWSLLAAANAQWADRRLLSSERFGIGGAQFLRAYDGSELLGDQGAAVKLELRHDFTWGTSSNTLYGFAETGSVRSFGGAKDDASNAGLGLRFTLFGRVNGFIEQAKPIDRDVGKTGNRKSRVFAGIGISL